MFNKNLKYWIFSIFLIAIWLVQLSATETNSAIAGSIVINEFMAGNTNTIADPQGQYDDWIELYNVSDSTVSVKGLYLTDDKNNIKKWQFPDTAMAPHGYLLIWADNDTNAAPGLHAYFKLNLGGEFIGLYDSNSSGNVVIDSVSFDHQYNGVSYGRQTNGTGAFLFSTVPTPNAANIIPAIDLRSKVVINEIMATNSKTITDPQGKFADWIELYNRTDSSLSLWGTSLTDDQSLPAKWMFPDVVISPHGYLLIWTDNDETTSPGIHTNFRLDGVNGEYVGFYSVKQNNISSVDSIFFGPQKADTSYGRYPDGSESFRLFPFPTPEKANKLVGSSALQSKILINELMAGNTKTIYDPQGQYDDWIELYNKADSTISLIGKYLTDNPDFSTKWKFPDISIAPHGYLLIWVDGDSLDTPGIHANFKLSKNGEFVGLYDDSSSGNGLIDSLSFGAQKSDTSYGRYPDAGNTFYFFPNPTPNRMNEVPTAVDIEAGVSPESFYLYQNYPNPFNQGTIIAYQLPRTTRVILNVYNLLGQKVKTLVNDVKDAGNYSVQWDGTNDGGALLSSGIYFYKIEMSSGFTKSAKMLLLK